MAKSIPLTGFKLLVLAAVLTAGCAATTAPDEESACFASPYAAPIGLEVGGRGQVLSGQFGLNVRDVAEDGEVIAQLDPLETFVVVSGPDCWHIDPTSNNRADHRLWYVRSEARDLEGWIDEYGWSLLTGVVYHVNPLAGDDPGIVVGTPLEEPVTFTGDLEWTSLQGPLEPRQKQHTITFEDYGYITVEVQSDDSRLLDPDLHGTEERCRIIGFVEDTERGGSPDGVIFGTTMQASDLEVDRLYVKPGDYEIQIALLYIPSGNSTSPPSCPDATYEVTIFPG